MPISLELPPGFEVSPNPILAGVIFDPPSKSTNISDSPMETNDSNIVSKDLLLSEDDDTNSSSSNSNSSSNSSSSSSSSDSERNFHYQSLNH